MSSILNMYVQGNRIKVTATVSIVSSGSLATPTDWALKVKNLADDSTFQFTHISSVDTLPNGMNAVMTLVSTGVIDFFFDYDLAGELAIRFEGSGAVKVAGEDMLVIPESRVL